MVQQAPAPKLVIRKVLGNVTLDLVDQESWTIGRQEGCDVLLQDTWASRQHAMIKRTEAGDFYFEDLGSYNGSMVNGQVVVQPVLLQDGDVLTIGTSEIEFCYPSDADPRSLTPTPPKTVLITRTLPYQAEVWRALLTSQGLNVQVDETEIDLRQMLQELAFVGHPLPDLLIVDLEAQKSKTYAFCRWCRESFPNLKLVLISATRSEIFPVERQWAIYQGAQDLLAGFPRSNLIANPIDLAAKVDLVLQALNWRPIHQKPMIAALLEVQQQFQ